MLKHIYTNIQNILANMPARVCNKRCLQQNAIVVTTCLLLLTTLTLRAQTDITLQDVVMGKAEVSAPNSVTLRPGFQAVNGSDFHAYIGPAQAQNSATTVSSPSGSTTQAMASTDNNYIRSITYREAETTGSFKHLEDIQYFDGLGRPMQTVSVGASPAGNDIIQPILYDVYGREAIKTLPYTDTKSGAFRTNVTESTVNTYYNSGNLVGKVADNHAYIQFEFDNSPLNRVTSQTGPGDDWFTNSKSVLINYLANTDPKPGWNVNNDGTFTSISYAANMLYVTETIDEQGNTTREYKDKQGQVVRKESKLGSDWLATSYVYDDFGLLRCVVPPEASDPNTDTGLCYYYNYDSRHRMTQKKIPGGGTVTMVYDKRDRLRFTQDSKQSAAGEWAFTKYDNLNRPVMTGTITGTSSSPFTASGLAASADAGTLSETRNNTSPTGYDNASYPTSGTTVLAATFYDDYAFIDSLSLGDSLKSITYDDEVYNIASQLASSTKGRVTGTMTMVLSDATDAAAVPRNKLFSSTYYDKYGHVLRTIASNHLGGKDVVTNLYEDITYQVLHSRQQHFKGAEHITLEKNFEYDHTGRLLATREMVNTQPEITMNAMKYDELGEMVTKYLHSAQTDGSRSFVQKVDYQYNIRGWLTQINDPSLSSDNDLFGMLICYNKTDGMGSLAPSQGLYNGNIVGMEWNIKNDMVRGYQFSYDGLNRLLNANYADGASLADHTGYYSEAVSVYDKNGNIKNLQRYYNNTQVDNLSYAYFTKTNQLQKITDTGTPSSDVDDYPGTSQDYTYDANGNMDHDGSRNMNIDYHRTLNLPQALDFGNNNRIFYHYTASGTKLIKHVKPATGTEGYTHYIGNIVYEGGTLSYILTDEGRLVPTGTGSDRKFLYEYNLKDHLGNNRVTFMGSDLGGAVDVVQTTNYYPFGLTMNQTNGNTAPGYQKNKYLYNGKELQDDNLNGTFFGMLDYGFRFYDPQIGRFHSADPRVEKYFETSPYTYALDNPVVYLDPKGDTVLIFIDKQGAGERGHMAMAYQDDNGLWYYFSQGATGNPGVVGLVAGSNADGGLDLKPLKVTDQVQAADGQGNPVFDQNGNPVMITIERNPTMSEVESMAQSGQLGYQYDDKVTLNTTRAEDKKISETASQLRQDFQSGKEKYNVYFNNCTDAVQTAIQKNTNINLPIDFDPRPNKYFEKLKKNISKINAKRRKQP